MFNIGSSPVDDMGALMANMSHPIARTRAMNSIAQKYGGVDKFASYYSRLTGKDPQEVANQVRNSLLAAGDSTDAAHIQASDPTAAMETPQPAAPVDPLAAQGPNTPTNPSLNANGVTPIEAQQRGYARGGIVQHFDDGGYAEGNLPPQRLPMWLTGGLPDDGGGAPAPAPAPGGGGLSGQATAPAAAAPGTGGIVPPDQSKNPYAADLAKADQNFENYTPPTPRQRSDFEKWLPLLTAGLGMGASKNLSPFGALSEGALLGVKQFGEQRKEEQTEARDDAKLAQQFQLEKMKERITSLRALSSDWTKSDIERQRADMQAKSLSAQFDRLQESLAHHSDDQIRAQGAAADRARETQLAITDRNNAATASRERIAALRTQSQEKINSDKNDLKALLQTQAENAKQGLSDDKINAQAANLQKRIESNEYVAGLRENGTSSRAKQKIALTALQNGNPELYRALAPDLGLDVSDDAINAISNRKSVNTAVQQASKLYGQDDADKRLKFVTAFTQNGGDTARALEEAGPATQKGTIHTYMDGDNRVTALLDKSGNELKRISTAPRSTNYTNWVLDGGTPEAAVVRSNDGKTYIDANGDTKPLPSNAQKMHTIVQQGADFTTPQKKEGVDYRQHEVAAGETVNAVQRLREQLADTGTLSGAVSKTARFLDISANQAHQAFALANSFSPGAIEADKELLDSKKFRFDSIKDPAAKSAAFQNNLTQLAYTVARTNVGGRLSNYEVQSWIDRLGAASKTQLAAVLDEVESHAVQGISTRREQAQNYGVKLPDELSTITQARERMTAREAAAKAAPQQQGGQPGQAAAATPAGPPAAWTAPANMRSGRVYGPDPKDGKYWKSLGGGRLQEVEAP